MAFPILPVIIAGLAYAYFLRPRKQGATQAPRRGLPPVPTPDPVLDGTELDLPDGSVHEGSPPPDPGAWSDLSFGFEVYPADVKDYRLRVGPPSTEESIVTSPGCAVAVVGEAWWDRVGDYVNAHLASGVDDPDVIAELVHSRELGACEAGPAVDAILDELRARVAAVLDNEAPQPATPTVHVPEEDPTEVPQFAMPPGAELTQHSTARGVHRIALLPKKVYSPALGQTIHFWEWYAWKPHQPLRLSVAFARGDDESREVALAQARDAIKSYHSVGGTTQNGRRSGAPRRKRKPRRGTSLIAVPF